MGKTINIIFIEDADHPYIQEKPFDWIRGYQVGGKSLTWGRACQRWSQNEFESPAKYGYGIEWPVSYNEMAPWYSHVEKFIGVCGTRDGIEAMPDGEFLPPFDMNCAEKQISDSIKSNYSGRHLVHARWAHLTQPQPVHFEQGRVKCLSRNLCMRGCPLGGYFSSVSSTLPWAKKTGNLTVRPHSVVHSIIYDHKKEKATGVRIIDSETMQPVEYFAKVIFLNASALNSNLILLNSKSNRFPQGFGNDNGLLGKYIAHHNYRASVWGNIEGLDDKYYFGRNPTEPILANYRNLYKQEMDYVGGFTSFMGANRSGYKDDVLPATIGAEFKEAMCEPGQWSTYMYLQGETIPLEKNHVRLSADRTDKWGIPLLIASVDYDANSDRMVKDFLEQSAEMLDKAGVKNIGLHDNHQPPGLDIHEMGGVRMGKDPKTSLLNGWNQFHAAKNVFVTDGACMTSTGNQSPSILYMALTARAANHAVQQLKKGNL